MQLGKKHIMASLYCDVPLNAEIMINFKVFQIQINILVSCQQATLLAAKVNHSAVMLRCSSMISSSVVGMSKVKYYVLFIKTRVFKEFIQYFFPKPIFSDILMPLSADNIGSQLILDFST